MTEKLEQLKDEVKSAAKELNDYCLENKYELTLKPSLVVNPKNTFDTQLKIYISKELK